MIFYLLSFVIGLVAAIIDVGPMLAKKLDKTFVFSAFFMWLALGIIIPRAAIIPIPWLNGVIVALLFAIPIICLVTKLDKPAIPIMIITTILLGAGIGFVSELIIK